MFAFLNPACCYEVLPLGVEPPCFPWYVRWRAGRSRGDRRWTVRQDLFPQPAGEKAEPPRGPAILTSLSRDRKQKPKIRVPLYALALEKVSLPGSVPFELRARQGN